MITSMTGFGRGTARLKGFDIQMEIRSVNNRYLELNVRLPKRYSTLEKSILETARKYLLRGKVDITIFIQENNSQLFNYKLNRPAIKQYYDLLQQIRATVPVQESPGFHELLHFDDIYTAEENIEVLEAAKKACQSALVAALKSLRKVQEAEGAYLQKDVVKRLNAIEKMVAQIVRLAPKRYPHMRKQLRGRVDSLLRQGDPVSSERLEQEIVLLVDKMDITEECVRLSSHLALSRATLKKKGSIGKKLDFILQEMNRETNTIGSKSNHFSIARIVVDMKDEVERLKEQIRNIN